MKFRVFPLLLAICAFCFFSAHSMRGQNTTGSITGRLTDTTGAVIAGAKISVKNSGTGEVRTLTTGGSGDFTATLLLPGRYSVTAEHTGFKTAIRNDITLEVDQTVRADLTLDVGSETQKVEVAGSALTLDTDSPAVAQTINEKQVSELPLNGRSFVSLLFLEPGAVQTGGEQSTYRYAAGDAISIGGGISASNAYTLDGTMITDTGYSTPAFDISIDAVQEFKEQTKNYSAEYGFGANQVNLSTKSGTNTFHGSAFEFIRNTAVDARSYFNRLPQPVAPLKQNQFGYSLGGPVILPKIYNGRNRTFFFANYEGQRIRSQVTETGNVPTSDELNGVFQISSFNPAQAATGTIIDPYTGLPFPKNATGAYVIPQSRFSRLAQLAIARGFFPAPNVSGNSAYNYTGNLQSNVDEDQQTYRIDQILGQKDSAFFRATISDVNVTVPGAPTMYTNTDILQVVRNYQLTETHIFTPNLLNQLRLGYLESQVYRQGPIMPAADIGTLGFQNVFGMNNANYPVIALASGVSSSNPVGATQALTSAGGAANLPTGSLQPAWDFSDSVSWNRGKHSIGVGFVYHSLQLDRQSTVNPQGNFTFDGELTHNQLADFLLGTAIKAQDAQPGPVSDVAVGNVTHLVFRAWAPYFQDDWKVSRRLTLNLGLRYEFTAVPYEEQNHLAWFNPVSGGGLFVANKFIVQNYGGSLYTFTGQRGPGPAQKYNFAPRLGFAFRPTGADSLVVRGGYGIFWDSFQTNEFVSSTAVYPFAPTQVYTSATSTMGTIYNTNALFPALTVGPVSQATFLNSVLQIAATRKLNPYEQDWSFGVERQLGPKTILNLDYVGNKATHINIRTELNQPTPCNAATDCNPDSSFNQSAAGKQLRRPYPNLGLMVYEGWNGYSNYNALNVKVQRRAKDVTLLAAYAWSKMMDVKSAAAAVSGDAFGAYGPQNSHCLPCDYARSSYDVGQRFVASFLYNLPFGQGQWIGGNSGGALNAFIGGWQFNGIATVQGGFPFTVTANDHGFVNEAYALRANLVPGVSASGFHQRIGQWFNTAAFTQPPDGYFGDSPRNVLRSPGVANVDLSFFKNIQLERVGLQFRFESFNALNHPEFGFPNPNVNAGAGVYGAITSINTHYPQRQNQAALRLTF
ncbi:MAG: carboxypeptidase-like regulatory domain-containing protein [Acidobacteriaceae bacterium]